MVEQAGREVSPEAVVAEQVVSPVAVEVEPAGQEV